MHPHQPRGEVSVLFWISMWWRVIYGVIKFFLGLYFIQHVGSSYTDLLPSFLLSELGETPHEHIMGGIYGAMRTHEQAISYFVAIYFIFWGVVDVILSYCLLRRIVWTFPLSLVVIAVFVGYEIVRVAHTHSLILAWIIIVDIGIMYLIYDEYKKLVASEVLDQAEGEMK